MRLETSALTSHFGRAGVALTDGKTELTYLELPQQIEAAIHSFRQQDVRSLAIYARNSIAWCIAYLACLIADIKVFPVARQSSRKVLLDLCQRCRINAILSDEPLGDIGQDCDLLPGLPDMWFTLLNKLEYTPQLSDVVTVLFTSGTTGQHKGVMLTKENITCNAQSVVRYMGYSPRDCLLVVKPLCHSSTLTAEFLAGIQSGATLYIMREKFSAPGVMKVLNASPISILCGVPTMFVLLVRHAAKYAGALRAVSISASPAHRELLLDIQETFRCDVYHVYGLTEASPRVAYLDPKHLAAKSGSIGKAIPDVEVCLVDKQGNSINAPHSVGELVVQGRNVMKGYYGDDGLTREVLTNGLLHTGDLAYMDEEGFLYLCGRKDDMIARGGVNIWPEPIERAIKQLGYIEDVAVIGVENYLFSQKIVALVSSRVPIEESEIAKICQANDVVCPDAVVRVDAVPRNSVGKIDRALLRDRWSRAGSPP